MTEITIHDQSKGQLINKLRLKKSQKCSSDVSSAMLLHCAREWEELHWRLCEVLGSGSQGEFQAEAIHRRSARARPA